MLRSRRLLLAVLFALGSFLAPVAAAQSDADIDRLFSQYNRPDVPGASVAVFRNGEVLVSKGYGLAELSGERPATETTNYRLASVSKAFTAMAVMILKERGQLNYDDSIVTYLTEFPSYGRRITIRHLLGHTSGLRDYESHLPPDRGVQLKDADVVDILASLRSTYFSPGSRYRYSNSGYAMLAEIVARVSGQRFSEFLKENVFDVLGMDQTVAYERGLNEVTERAYGYTPSSGRFRLTDQSQTSAVLGDGGVYTSVAEFQLWDQALSDDSLVSRETLAEAFTPGRTSDGRRTSYGFGWQIDTYRGHARVSHTGSTIGFRTAVQRFPEQDLTIVVLINRAGSSPWTIAARIADMYL